MNRHKTNARALVVLSNDKNAAKMWRRAFGPKVRTEPVAGGVVALHIRPGYWSWERAT